MKIEQGSKPVETVVHPKKVVHRFDFPAESETELAHEKQDYLMHLKHNLI